MGMGIKTYLHKLKKYIDFSVQLLAISFTFGVFIAIGFRKETESIVNWAGSALSPGIELRGAKLFVFIFDNNVNALFYSLLESAVFGLSSIAMLIANGIILGVFMVLVSQKQSFIYFLIGILPHGIIELPAAIITGSMGIKIGSTVALRLLGKKVSVFREIYQAVKYFLVLVVPLLLVAAFIEAFITPALLVM